MFVGHYAAAMAAKTVEPRAPLWTLVAGCQLLDMGWSSLVIAAVEKVRVDPSLPGSPLDLYYMPFTHSLPAAILWSAAATLAARYFLRLAWAPSSMVGATVFSHWLLDLLVHRPDLELFPHGLKVGLAFWNFPIPEMALEMGLVAISGAAWTASRRDQGRSAWPAVVFIGLLTLVQVAASLTGGSGGSSNPVTAAAMALGVYLVITAVSVLVDRQNRSALKPAGRHLT